MKSGMQPVESGGREVLLDLPSDHLVHDDAERHPVAAAAPELRQESDRGLGRDRESRFLRPARARQRSSIAP